MSRSVSASESSSKCRKSKLLRGYRRIPDLISPSAAADLAALVAAKWSDQGTATGIIEESLALARMSMDLCQTNSPD